MIKYILSGGLVGFVLFLIFFTIADFINSGTVNIMNAFFQDAITGHQSIFPILNWIIISLFIAVGLLAGWVYGKLKR